MNYNELTNFDYILIFLTLISAIFALLKGFIKSIIGFTAMVLSFLLAYFLHPELSILFKSHFQNPLIANLFSSILSYSLAAFVLSFLSKKLITMCEELRGGAIDRILGLAFGVFRGYLISCIIFLVVVTGSNAIFATDDEKDKKQHLPGWITKAKTFPLLVKGSDHLASVLPKNFAELLLNEVNQMQNGVETQIEQKMYQELIDQIPTKEKNELEEELSKSEE